MGIYDDWKYRKNFYKYGTRIISDKVQSNVADDVSAKKNKNSIKYNYDEGMIVQGQKWFDDGYLLEDAPEEMRNNSVFIDGYIKARDRKQEVYDLGVQSFINGISFKDIPKIYQNNIDFMQGYNDAIDQSMINGIDWKNIPSEFLEDDNIQKGRHR